MNFTFLYLTGDSYPGVKWHSMNQITHLHPVSQSRMCVLSISSPKCLHSTKITITHENPYYSQISRPMQAIMKNISFPQSASNKLKLEYEFGTVLWKTKWLASLHQMAVLPNTSYQACWSFGLICWVAWLLIPDIPLTCSNKKPC